MHSTDFDFPLMAPQEFLHAMGGERELCLTILETALEEAEEQVSQILELSERSEKETACAVLHSLRGGSATFEAVALVSLLQRMESACEAEGVPSILSSLAAFETEALRYREALRCLVNELGARP